MSPRLSLLVGEGTTLNDSYDIKVTNDDNGTDQHSESHKVDQSLPFRRNAFAAADPLDRNEHDATAIKGRYRKNVQDGKVQTKQCGEFH